MNRRIAVTLDTWLGAPDRRPLVLRGARQVGKTWLVRDLAARSGRELFELNFERDPRLRQLFESNDPQVILGEISLRLNRRIEPQRSLLFLDEIQAAGELLGKLRWFYEELPSLPVVAAGSLLELTLSDHTFSMPVGRITYRHVEPMGFDEFLLAHGQDLLLHTLAAWRTGTPLSPAAHDSATVWFDRYVMVGGMPSVVAADAAGRSAHDCRLVQRDLVSTYRDDFARYRGRIDVEVLDAVLLTVAGSIGRKFVYARVGQGVKGHQAKQALDRLAAARLCHVVRYSAANGVPLAAEAKDTFRKAFLLDVGLLQALLGTPATDAYPSWASLPAATRGQLSEQVAAQQLRLLGELSGNAPELFYWQREGGRPGEVDFLIQLHGRILPIELKSGVAGAMKSLHQFMFDKGLARAIRLDRNPPSTMAVAVKTTQGDEVGYQLVSLPAYMAWNLSDILA